MLQSMRLQWVEHDLVTEQQQFYVIYIYIYIHTHTHTHTHAYTYTWIYFDKFVCVIIKVSPTICHL